MDLTRIGTLYAGFVIKPRPFHRQSGEWTLDLRIWRDGGDAIGAREFHGRDTFPTEAAAIRACVRFGEEIIDGRIPGLSIA